MVLAGAPYRRRYRLCYSFSTVIGIFNGVHQRCQGLPRKYTLGTPGSYLLLLYSTKRLPHICFVHDIRSCTPPYLGLPVGINSYPVPPCHLMSHISIPLKPYIHIIYLQQEGISPPVLI